MSDIALSTASPSPRARLPKAEHPDIELPDGEVLRPRVKFAADIGVSDKTAQRLNLPSTLVGGVVYVAVNASLKQIAARVKRRNDPPRHRRSK